MCCLKQEFFNGCDKFTTEDTEWDRAGFLQAPKLAAAATRLVPAPPIDTPVSATRSESMR